MDLYTEEPYIEPLLDKIEEYATGCGLTMIDLGADMIWAGDDVGTQNGMMISPAIWRERLKPRMKRMFDTFRKRNPDIKIAYHSCGSIREVIPDFIEIGLDILNPLQPLAANMEFSSIYNEFSDRLIFFGGVDVQNLLPKGSIQDIKNEVRRLIEASKGERYILAPAHNIQPDTPVENVLALFEAVEEYGYNR